MHRIPLPVGPIGPARLPVYPPVRQPVSGTTGGTEGYGGGSYSGSSDPGGVDFGDKPVIHLF